MLTFTRVGVILVRRLALFGIWLDYEGTATPEGSAKFWTWYVFFWFFSSHGGEFLLLVQKKARDNSE